MTRNNGSGRSNHSPKKPAVNLQALAERILQLLKEEARIERERLGRRGS
jgi:hypothetical protein